MQLLAILLVRSRAVVCRVGSRCGDHRSQATFLMMQAQPGSAPRLQVSSRPPALRELRWIGGRVWINVSGRNQLVTLPTEPTERSCRIPLEDPSGRAVIVLAGLAAYK